MRPLIYYGTCGPEKRNIFQNKVAVCARLPLHTPQSCRTITIRVSFCTLKSSYFTLYEEDSTRAVSEDRAVFRSAHLVSPRM